VTNLWSTKIRIGPLHFHAGGCTRQLDLDLFFFWNWRSVVVYFVADACLLCLCLFQFFSTKPRDWPSAVWEECLQNGLFCVKWDVKPQLNQSVAFLIIHLALLILIESIIMHYVDEGIMFSGCLSIRSFVHSSVVHGGLATTSCLVHPPIQVILYNSIFLLYRTTWPVTRMSSSTSSTLDVVTTADFTDVIRLMPQKSSSPDVMPVSTQTVGRRHGSSNSSACQLIADWSLLATVEALIAKPQIQMMMMTACNHCLRF